MVESSQRSDSVSFGRSESHRSYLRDAQNIECDSSRLLQRLLSAGHQFALFIIDDKRRVRSWSGGAQALLGFSESEMLGREIDVLAPGHETSDRIISRLLIEAKEKGSADKLLWLQPKEGKRVWGCCLVLSLGAEEDSHFGVVVHDHSEHTRVEEELRRSEERLRLALDSSALGVWELSFPERALLWSERCREIWGARAGTPIDYDLFLAGVHPEDAERVGQAVEAALRPGGRYEIEYRIIGVHDRRERWIEAKGEAVFNERGAPIRFLGTVADVTEKRRLARELQRSNRELENFACFASHELQEPLRMVGTYLRLLAKRFVGQLDSQSQDYLNFAMTNAERLRGMVDGVLHFSRLQRTPLARGAVDCNLLVQHVLRDLGPRLAQVHADLRVGPLPKVVGDRILLAQLFLNLIGNSIKYRSSRPLRIEIGCDAHEGGWLFSIRDNGEGIAEEFQIQIFDLFVRLNSHDETQGSGIGLAICRRIVERHGGRLWVESTVGEGSTFFFTLPGPNADQARATRP